MARALRVGLDSGVRGLASTIGTRVALDSRSIRSESRAGDLFRRCIANDEEEVEVDKQVAVYTWRIL